jgi:hypothetical protein
MDVDLSRLGPDEFEHLCQALAVQVLGAGVVVFGAGPDGGREASFDGQLPSFPTSSAPWGGYVVVQAKYKATLTGTADDLSWLQTQIRKELDAWSDRTKARVRDGRRPEYLIFATNVSLSAVPGRGGKDRIDQLIEGYAATIGLKGYRVWDSTQILTYLRAYPDIRRSFASLITSSEVLADLLGTMSSSPSRRDDASSPPRVRPGQPGLEAVFEPAHQAAGGAAYLGDALDHAREEGPGWVQHFPGGPAGEPAVLCALPGRPAVAVARAVWHDMGAIGTGAPHSGVNGVGFPVVEPPNTGVFIRSDSSVVDLAGGTWTTSGRSQLLRPDGTPPRWQPPITFDREACRTRTAWTDPTDKRDLRVRAAAQIPLVADEWRITHTGRTRLEAALDRSGMDNVLQQLAARYDLPSNPTALPSRWKEIPAPLGRNNSRFASYHLSIPGVDDRPILAACAYLMLPDGHTTHIESIVDVRVDFTAATPASDTHTPGIPADVPAAHRLTFNDLVTCLTHTWHTATTVLPHAAAADPEALPPAGAPRIELYIESERRGDHQEEQVVRTLDTIDLSERATPRDLDTRTLSVGVTAALHLSKTQVAATVDEALVRMAEDAGFAITVAAGSSAPPA